MTAAESVNEEAVEAAAAAISSRVCPGRPWGDTADEDKPHYREEARAALAAAVPHLERRIRESIAGEIEAQHREWRRIYPGYAVGNATFNEGLDRAARIARGSVSS